MPALDVNVLQQFLMPGVSLPMLSPSVLAILNNSSLLASPQSALGGVLGNATGEDDHGVPPLHDDDPRFS